MIAVGRFCEVGLLAALLSRCHVLIAPAGAAFRPDSYGIEKADPRADLHLPGVSGRRHRSRYGLGDFLCARQTTSRNCRPAPHYSHRQLDQRYQVQRIMVQDRFKLTSISTADKIVVGHRNFAAWNITRSPAAADILFERL